MGATCLRSAIELHHGAGIMLTSLHDNRERIADEIERTKQSLYAA